MRYIPALVLLVLGVLVIATGAPASAGSANPAPRPAFDLTTLAGKVASVQAMQGRHLSLSGIVEWEAERSAAIVAARGAAIPALIGTPVQPTAITPTYVLTSPLDGTSVRRPAVTVNQDTDAASQNEPAIAVDPGNPKRIVVGANDYASRTWSCMIEAVPCSLLGDGYSGTYYSNDGGKTWCCVSTDPEHLGTIVPGVTRLAGGQYDAAGDPALAFDSRGRVYYAGLGFDRASPANTIAVNQGTFDRRGHLRWGPPTFIGQTTDPTIFNDKEWVAADSNKDSRYRDRVYVSWTVFMADPTTGNYVQSPIAIAYSKNGGRTFSDPQVIVGDVIYDQGSRVAVGSDGTVYVAWLGSRLEDAFNSIWIVRSKDGGRTWSKPVAVAPLIDILPPANTVFRTNSFPAMAVRPDGTVYVAWSSEVGNAATAYTADPACAYWIVGVAAVYANCHSAAVWSKLSEDDNHDDEDHGHDRGGSDHGARWSSPVPILPSVDASNRVAEGYPVQQADGSWLEAPAPRRADTFWPGVAASPSGRVYMSAYAADVVSPWQTCARPDSPTSRGRINCLVLGPYVNNAKLDYFVTNIRNDAMKKVTTHPVNTRYHFGGGFIGDYTDLAVGSDNVFHAAWTDTNNVQSVTWWYGDEFVPTAVHQQDIVTGSGRF